MANNWNDKADKNRAAARKVEKKPAVAGSAKAKGPEPTYEQIAIRAFALWEKQGRPEGQQMENWLEAEKELREEAGF